jgi:hypothetical protein
MEIGNPARRYVVEPITTPVPVRVPLHPAPEPPVTPVHEPVPA